jgi:ribosome-associated protein
MMDFIQQPMETTVGDAREGSAHLDPEDLEFVTTIVQAADGRKADDIVVLHVGNVSTLTSFLVLLSGNSRPQNQAIAAAIVKDVQERYALTPGGSGVPEGSAESGWMLLDYGNVMVHVMTPKSRLYYNVEGQWKEKGGIPVDMDHVLVPNQVETVSTDRMDDGFVAAEDDPFWS